MAEYKFTKYVRLILPMDGYVFWVRSDLLTPFTLVQTTVMGSFHYATDQLQEEAETYSRNRVAISTCTTRSRHFRTFHATRPKQPTRKNGRHTKA